MACWHFFDSRLTTSLAALSEHPWANTSWHTAQIDSSSIAKPRPPQSNEQTRINKNYDAVCIRSAVGSFDCFDLCLLDCLKLAGSRLANIIFHHLYITQHFQEFWGSPWVDILCLSSVNVQASPFILLTAASSHTCYLASAFTAPCCQRCNASNFTSQTAFLKTLL